MKPKLTGVLVRFETDKIGPVQFPRFLYTASALSQRTIQYTALVFVQEDEEPQSAENQVLACWPGAMLINVENEVSEFRPQDLRMTNYVYGVYDNGLHTKKISWWRAFLGFFSHTPSTDFGSPTRPRTHYTP